MSEISEIVTSVIEMDKKIESLKRENQLLKDQNSLKQSACSCVCDSSEKEGRPNIDDIIFEMGLESLYQKLFYASWHEVKATRNDNGEVVYTPFDDFITKEFKNDAIPEKTSKFECLEKLRPLLLEKYKKECAKAYDELLESERKEEESEEDK